MALLSLMKYNPSIALQVGAALCASVVSIGKLFLLGSGCAGPHAGDVLSCPMWDCSDFLVLGEDLGSLRILVICAI